MFRMKAVAAVLAAVALSACGGGGGDAGTPVVGPGSGAGSGSGSGGTPANSSVAVSLQDSTGVPLTVPALTGTQNAFAVATVKNAQGAAVPNAVVTFTGGGLVFSPVSGQALTDANGVARVQVSVADPFAGGATTLSAASSVGSTQVQSTLGLALGAATSALGALSASAASVNAYQTVQVSVPVTLAGSVQPAVQYPVSFSASCGTFDPASTLSGSAGIATATYRNQAGSTACSGTVTLRATAGSAAVTTTIAAVAPSPANLQFVDATPTRIFLGGSPGPAQSQVSFKLVDSGGNPVSGANVELALTLRPTGAHLGNVVDTTLVQESTDANGFVSVGVKAGSAPGPVQIEATLLANRAIKNVSNRLSIASGLPVQRAFSLSVSQFNIEAWDEDGIPTTITLRIADRLGNPVPDGTTVNFITEGGQVVASCNTSGAESNTTSNCSVTLTSQSPRPVDGRITVLAWAQGEESFADAGPPTNNTYDDGELFADLGQPYLDKNENGQYDTGSDVTVASASGTGACPAGSTGESVPNTCDGHWGGNVVRASAVIVLSGSDPIFTLVNPLASSGPGRCLIRFNLADARNNPLPVDSVLSISNVVGGGSGVTPDAVFEGFGDSGSKIPNTSAPGPTQHSAVFSNCSTPSSMTFKLTVTTSRKAKATSFFLP